MQKSWLESYLATQAVSLCFMHSDALLKFLKGGWRRGRLEQCSLLLPSLDAV